MNKCSKIGVIVDKCQVDQSVWFERKTADFSNLENNPTSFHKWEVENAKFLIFVSNEISFPANPIGHLGPTSWAKWKCALQKISPFFLNIVPRWNLDHFPKLWLASSLFNHCSTKPHIFRDRLIWQKCHSANFSGAIVLSCKSLFITTKSFFQKNLHVSFVVPFHYN